MGWSEVNTTANDIKKHPGNPYIGTYTGHKEITTPIGQQTIWQFTNEDGVPFGVYGFTNLNRAMEGIAVGSVCRITYTGTAKVQTKFGMKDVHQVKVEVHTKEAEDENPFGL